MFSKSTIILVTMLAVSSTVTAQTLNVTCRFELPTQFTYTCFISDVTIPDDDNLDIVFVGEHLDGRGNDDVDMVVISSSSIPFIMPQLFTTFERFVVLRYSSNLTRIQPNAFANASNLREFHIEEAPELLTIPENAFVGAVRLVFMQITDSGIQTIHENAFNGLPEFAALYLNRLQIRELPVNVFRPVPTMFLVSLDGNLLESLPGRLFEANPLVFALFLRDNRINAVERNFLDFMPALEQLDLRNNICANQEWDTVFPGVDLETIREGLSVCFDNFEPVKIFHIELRGHMTIRDVNGTEVISL